jgi:hypothetical protein
MVSCYPQFGVLGLTHGITIGGVVLPPPPGEKTGGGACCASVEKLNIDWVLIEYETSPVEEIQATILGWFNTARFPLLVVKVASRPSASRTVVAHLSPEGLTIISTTVPRTPSDPNGVFT